MIYLVPFGGFYDQQFGVITTPGHKGIPSGIIQGMSWAADNQAFTKGFDPDIFFPWLDKMQVYKLSCLFVTCPDEMGDARATLKLFDRWAPKLTGWKLAFVAQDGQEDLDYPAADLWSALFIGGSTEWKMSNKATDCILRGQALGKHIHIGRVNYMRRYTHFASLIGSERFTCDGTRNRFEGTEIAIREWRKCMDSPKQYGLALPAGDCTG